MPNKLKTMLQAGCLMLLFMSLQIPHCQEAAAQASNPSNPMLPVQEPSITLDKQLDADTTSPIPNAQATVLPAPRSNLSSSGPPANFCLTDAGSCPLAATVQSGQNCLCTVGNQVYGGQTTTMSPTEAQSTDGSLAGNRPLSAQHPPPPDQQPLSELGPRPTDVSVLGMVRQSDVVVQAVMLFLVICSAASWTTFFYKSLTLANARRNTWRYTTEFQIAVTMDNAVDAVRTVGDGPARQMLSAASQEWALTLRATDLPLTPHQSTRLLQRLMLAMGAAQERALAQLGSYMGLLATVGSTAPFIGLFGTVWGILDSFDRISASSSTSLTVVAPGIAEALLATAVGLFTAIPATMFYNRCAREIGKITGQLDNVAAELLAFASRDIERLSK